VTPGPDATRVLGDAAFKVLADPTRARILAFLLEPVQSCCRREDGVCGCDLETFLGVSQPTVSHHMKALVEVGLVTAEKRGRWVYYDLVPARLAALADGLAAFARAAADATPDAPTAPRLVGALQDDGPTA
jgi:ArsR family transcriptional regulator